MRCVFLLLLCLIPAVLAVLTDFEIYHPTFNDPYSGSLKAVLLDIDVLPCTPVALQSIVVTLPLGPVPGQTNAHFVGPAFGPRQITGFSVHNAVVTTGTKLWVSWDGSTRLTFSGFNSPDANGVVQSAVVNIPAGSPDPNWVNINWDVPDGDWVDPTAPGFVDSDMTKIPLKLVPFNPFDAPSITLTDTSDFEAIKNPDIPCRGGSGTGDPVFSGFQGQVFQFHGLPDEHFNLVSSPDVQLNSHFVYLSSGKCDYNDTECFTHPGTYMDVLGFAIADSHVKLVASTHEQGLRVWVNDIEIHRGAYIGALSDNTTASLRYHYNGRVEIHTGIMNFEIVNSDMFMNIRVGLNNQQLMRVGATKHTVTDHIICKTNSETHDHHVIETTVASKYPVNTPLHGLIGQTWRNVKVCGRDWMGTVQDYLVSDLFGSDYHYNYFQW